MITHIQRCLYYRRVRIRVRVKTGFQNTKYFLRLKCYSNLILSQILKVKLVQTHNIFVLCWLGLEMDVKLDNSQGKIFMGFQELQKYV